MTWHLFGNILTSYGTAANNRGENEGNITTLQKLLWKGEVHTTIFAEAIRWALRYYWQTANDQHQVNRRWDDVLNDNIWQNAAFDDGLYIDDDVLGFMKAEGAKVEENDASGGKGDGVKSEAGEPKQRGKKAPKLKGTTTAKRGVLEVTRAVSTLPFEGDITFNAASGQKNRTSLYGTEVHATRYQYGFAITPDRLKEKSRIVAVLDGLSALGEVAGNHSCFLYDFSPRLLYCFEEKDQKISVPDLVRRIEAGDIDPKKLWVVGAIATTEDGEKLKDLGVNISKGVKSAVESVNQ